MQAFTIIQRSLRYFARSHFALSLGIAAAVAVIVGALIVGDSVRRSLSGLVLDRLGKIETVLHARTFVSTSSFSAIETNPGVNLIPAIILGRSTVEFQRDSGLTRASNVQVVGPASEFWQASSDDTTLQGLDLSSDEIAINASLADELQAKVGDELTLRLSRTPGAPADNPLGRRDDALISLPRQKIVAVLPDDSVAGLSLVVGQNAPRNVFCSLPTLQDILECEDRSNAAIVTSDSAGLAASQETQELCDALNLQFKPELEDYGLTLRRHTRTYPDPEIDIASADTDPMTVFDYYQVSSDELVIDTITAKAITNTLERNQAVQTLTYLANSVRRVEPTKSDLSERWTAAAYEARKQAARRRTGGPFHAVGIVHAGAFETEETEVQLPISPLGPGVGITPPPDDLSRQVPYSIIVGIDLDANDTLQLKEHIEVPLDQLRIPYCWINEWLARELNAAPGDWFEMKFFEPETVDGVTVEATARFMIAGIVPLVEPVQPYNRRRPAKYDRLPSVFNDPNLTPSVPGVTDQDSISKWDLPFSIDEDLLLPIDDDYWNKYRLTPKIFAPLELISGRNYFGSRFGKATAIQVSAENVESEEELRTRLRDCLLETRPIKGLVFTPVRQQQLVAASGATPFDMLFLSLSFFVIVAALLLVTLLLKLGIQRRGDQLGLMFATGFTQGRVRSLLLREYACVAVGGTILGTVLGIGYAGLMIAALQSWWVGAISTPFLRFSFGMTSVLGGAAIGFSTCVLMIFLGLRRLSRETPLSLMRGSASLSPPRVRANRLLIAIAGGCFMTAVGLLIAGTGYSGMARAGTFFGCGFLFLFATLLATHCILETRPRKSEFGGNSLFNLAWRAISRNPVRSSMALGLLAVASFLIASMGVFQVAPSERGYGGFNLIGESSQPIFENISSASVRSKMLGDAAADKLVGSTVIPMRLRPGEDASCNNLFQASRPSVLGVPAQMRDLSDLSPDNVRFSWAATEKTENPWAPLHSDASGSEDNPIPVILDQNTAAWSLKQGASLGAIIRVDFDSQVLFFKTVGLLSNSVLQGKLLISQENFVRSFPSESGYRYFLIRSPTPQSADAVAQAFENGWSNEGLDVTYSEKTLRELLGVQNTYISAFQSLGTLGLLLGTFGLAAVQLRSVVERGREIALMQAVGFSRHRIMRMLTVETAIILTLGMAVGITSAALALVPYIIETGPQLSLFSTFGSLLAVLLVGFVAGTLAVRGATKKTVLKGLRSE